MSVYPERSRGARTVLGMTLYNNPKHVREATDSILGQTRRDFALLMLDDGSNDEVEAIAHAYERRDQRVRYWRHPQRQGMVPTWKEVVEIARREHPDAEYFAWVSDHDRWDPRWLGRMVAQLDAHPEAVLAYPRTLRIDENGVLLNKEPRAFDTSGIADPAERWRRFAWSGFGSGDMVYGLMRMRALEAAGMSSHGRARSIRFRSPSGRGGSRAAPASHVRTRRCSRAPRRRASTGRRRCSTR